MPSMEGSGKMQRRFGVVRMWPEHPVAEHENVERIKAAAQALDIEDWVNDKFPSYDDRIDLPNFVDKEWSNTINRV